MIWNCPWWSYSQESETEVDASMSIMGIFDTLSGWEFHFPKRDLFWWREYFITKICPLNGREVTLFSSKTISLRKAFQNYGLKIAFKAQKPDV